MIDIEQQIWGMTTDGQPVIMYTMTNAHGEYLRLTNQGAAVVGIGVRDRDGVIADVALGYQLWNSYAQGDDAQMGKSVGRCAGRIARGRFTLEGIDYQLPINQRPHHIHGGNEGLSGKLWQSRVEGNRVVFSYISPSGEGGYPGELGAEVVYDWDDDSVMEITYYAGSDSTTIVNLTNHLYLNLKGHDMGDIKDHQLVMYDCHRVLETDSTLIPTGGFTQTAGTAFDFSTAHRLGERFTDDALQATAGYDHYFAISGFDGSLRHVATLSDPTSGRMVDIITNQPGVMLYTGNFLQGASTGKGGASYLDHAGVALECMAMPDAINHTEFPSLVLHAGETYENNIILNFSAK